MVFLGNSRWCVISSINPISLQSYQSYQGGRHAVISPVSYSNHWDNAFQCISTFKIGSTPRDFRLWKRVSLASKCPGRWPRRKTNWPNQNALPVPCSQHHSLGLAISARRMRKAVQKDSMNNVGNNTITSFFRTEGGTSNSAKSHCKTKMQYCTLLGKCTVYRFV